MNIRIEQCSIAVVVADAGPVAPNSRVFAATGLKFYVAAALVFLASMSATVYLCRSMTGGMPMPGGWTMSMAWMRMPGKNWLGSGASFIAMWIVMMVAMMLPSLVPMLVDYQRSLSRLGLARCEKLTMLVTAGYFLMWTIAGLAVYPLGVVIANAAMRWQVLARLVPVTAGVVLMLAGYAQLTGWKALQLERCRSAPVCNQPVSPDAWSACRHGVCLGAQCILCCFNLTLVMFVSGVMDLGAMAAVAGAITLERIAPWPRRAAHITGVFILLLGAFKVARALLGA